MPAQMRLPTGGLNGGPLSEATLSCDVAAPGYFSPLIRATSDEYRQDHKRRRLRRPSYRLDRISCVLDRADPDRDSPLPQGTFFRPNRRVVSHWRAGVIFVDLDVYRTEAPGRIPGMRLHMARHHREVGGMPTSPQHLIPFLVPNLLRD